MKYFLEKNLLPIAMVLGIVFHRQLSFFSGLTPYLIATMLFITYCRVSWQDIRLTKFHYLLLAIQYIGSILIYCVLLPFNETVAQGVMICVLTATATSAPVVSGLLGGNVSFTAAYSIISNISVAFISPVFLTLIGHNSAEISYIDAFGTVFQRVMPVLLLPSVISILLAKIFPRVHARIKSGQIASFYLWAMALTIVISNVTRFVVTQSDGNYGTEIVLGFLVLLLCLSQFIVGRKIGRKFGETVAGGQSLGQKNTVLAIWLSQTYLNPLSSLGPGLYVLWQNLVNSYQIWKHKQSTTQK